MGMMRTWLPSAIPSSVSCSASTPAGTGTSSDVLPPRGSVPEPVTEKSGRASGVVARTVTGDELVDARRRRVVDGHDRAVDAGRLRGRGHGDVGGLVLLQGQTGAGAERSVVADPADAVDDALGGTAGAGDAHLVRLLVTGHLTALVGQAAVVDAGTGVRRLEEARQRAADGSGDLERVDRRPSWPAASRRRPCRRCRRPARWSGCRGSAAPSR